MKNVDRISGLVLIVFSAAGFFYSRATDTVSSVGLTANTFPQFLFICLALCGVGLIISAQRISADTTADIGVNFKGLLPVLAVLLVYVLVFKHIHFIATSVVFLALEMFIFGERRWKVIAPTAIIAPVVIFFLFTKVFNIILPA